MTHTLTGDSLNPDPDRSRSALSWDDDCDSEATIWVSNILNTIDDIIFNNVQTPKSMIPEMAEECQIWKEKFSKGMIINTCQCVKTKNNRDNQLKSLSAPNPHEQTSPNDKRFDRKGSNHIKMPKLTRTELEPINLDHRKKDKHEKINHIHKPEKPLILPPLNLTNIKKDQNPAFKTFPLPPLVLPIDDLLRKRISKSTKF